MSAQPAALLRACHPAPTVVVTLIAAALLGAAGCGPLTGVLGALAVLTGQLSIGWSNDLLDLDRDIATGRTDKPAATGAVSATALRWATVCALVATVGLSLALGWRAGLTQLVVVAAGWAYNVGLKSSALSPLPYFVAFGALPVVATQAAPEPHWPPVWVTLAGAVIGVSAHFANVLPDLGDDLATGVRGLPHRLGGRPTALVAATLTVGTGLLMLVFLAGWPAVVGVLVVLSLIFGALRLVRQQPGLAFTAIMLCAAVNVAVLATSDALRR